MSWTIQSRLVRAEIQTLGGMLGPAWFDLGDRKVQPFVIAPWSDEVGPEYEKLPRILQRLRGEWPCVPFGMSEARKDLPPDWRPDVTSSGDYVDPDLHGYSSNSHWQLVRVEPRRIELVLEYPPLHPIRRVVRTITASEEAPALEISLMVQSRAGSDLPIGVHPVLRLPDSPRMASLDFGGAPRAWTSPTPVEPGISRFKSDVRNALLTQMPTVSASGAQQTENMTRLPLPYPTEELVLVVGHHGSAMLTNHDESYSVSVSWDAEVFPACMLWLSNHGRDYHPWNRRFLGLGVEPIRSAFDLGAIVSRSRSNPLWRSGIPCTYSFSPEQDLETTYSIAVAEAGAAK
ncbi:MAG: hypothetical protein AUG06_05050 [Actinobacteria bacterium 13_1_20CM_2_65_11]|nr:MAG: hypothetical protein AUH69_03545 [Actinobacteria bacterium 13_1_40CM_4_65_12]OLD25749.1 MAG: hypothetical protein AUJ02_04310 [Chloroflexi bacterium 13_1_40CM_3_65_12]OLE80285.1 MAG: hypothetical protein AUG06_05050 [Actinobacteria bacterium 13_1_20CM_2_65_11]